MAREYDPIEEALVEQAAIDGLASINAYGTYLSTRTVQAGDRKIEVTVRVVGPNEVSLPRVVRHVMPDQE